MLFVVTGCAVTPGGDDTVVLISVTPDHVVEGQTVQITIEGRALEPTMYRNANCSGNSIEIDDVFQSAMGENDLESVIWIDGQHLEATVPDDLPAGTYSVSIVDPRGRTAVLEDAFTVLGAGDTDTDTDTEFDCSDNLLDNPGAEDGDMSGWEVTENGGYGWASIASEDAFEGDRRFGTSYEWCRRYQQIDLLSLGFTEEELDAEPEIRVSEWVGEIFEPDQYEVTVELLDVGQALIDNWTVAATTDGDSTCTTADCFWDDDDWIEVSHVFTGYGAGLRHIRFSDGSVDTEWWLDWYGAVFDAAEVIICQ